MNDHSTTFEAVTSSMLKILKEDFSRTDSTLEGYAWKWNQLRQFMENNDLHSLTPKVCDDFLDVYKRQIQEVIIYATIFSLYS